MVTPRLDFERQEYAGRLARLRKAMELNDIDYLIVYDPSNMAWLTGYNGWSFYTHQAVILGHEGDPIWYGREMDTNCARRTVYMDNDHIIGYPDEYVQNPHQHPLEYLAGIFTSRGWLNAQIGVEMDNYYFSAAAYEALKKNLPNARFVDVTGMVNWERSVKSETELSYMRRAGKIVERMHQRIVDKMEPGLRKCDLVAEIYDAGLRYYDEGSGDGFGGDYPAIVPLLPSGSDAAASHLTWDDRVIEKGAGTFFEIAGVYQRYHCPLSRTVYLGKPPQYYLDAEQAVLEGIEAGLEVAKVGNFCEDIAIAFFDTLTKHGLEKDSRTGYSIGLSFPPDWGERTMSLRRGDKTVLKENMTFHFMSGIWVEAEESWGLEITESIIIKENKPECLANVPRKLFIKD